MLDERQARTSELFSALKERTQIVFEAAEQARLRAEEATDKHFLLTNQWAERLKEQSRDYLLSSVYKVQHEGLIGSVAVTAQRISDLERKIATMEAAQATFERVDKEHKDESKASFTGIYQAVGMGGVFFAILVSMVTVVFNIWTYHR
jgi:hypothetical protein